MNPLSQLSILLSVTLLTSLGIADSGKSLWGAPACELGHQLVDQNQLERAMLYLDRCHQFSQNSDLRRKLIEIRIKLKKRRLATVALVFQPEDATATIEGLFSKDVLLNNDELWLPIGNYKISVHADGHQDAEYMIDVESADRSVVSLSLEINSSSAVIEIDMGNTPGAELGEVSHAADMREKKFKTLLARRYTRAPDPKIPTDKPAKSRHGIWPALLLLSSASAVGASVTLQLKEHQTSAFIGYSSGFILGGLAVYLFVHTNTKRSGPDTTTGPVVSIKDESAHVGYTLVW